VIPSEFPVVDAYAIQAALPRRVAAGDDRPPAERWAVWCRPCKRWHTHLSGAVVRSTHCEEGPLLDRFYRLRLVGAIAVDAVQCEEPPEGADVLLLPTPPTVPVSDLSRYEATRARRAWPCDGCGLPIEPGTGYLKLPASASGQDGALERLHRECQATLSALQPDAQGCSELPVEWFVSRLELGGRPVIRCDECLLPPAYCRCDGRMVCVLSPLRPVGSDGDAGEASLFLCNRCGAWVAALGGKEPRWCRWCTARPRARRR